LLLLFTETGKNWMRSVKEGWCICSHAASNNCICHHFIYIFGLLHKRLQHLQTGQKVNIMSIQNTRIQSWIGVNIGGCSSGLDHSL
jgi:hypothetical protein